jgi:predicted MFS family arabinose efflux permease
VNSFKSVPRDAAFICAAGGTRAAAVSLVGVIIAIHLASRGLSASGIGLIIGTGIAASAAGTVITALRADRWGRRRTLIVLGVLTGGGYAALAFTDTRAVLLLIAVVAMLNGIGRDRGPASALEQALLPSTTSDERRNWTMAWYNAAIDSGHALGALGAALPTRQSYVMAVVPPSARTYASGMTNVTRNAGWAVGPLIGGTVMQHLSLAAPLLIGGSLKILYDIALYRSFRHLKAPEERRDEAG